MARFAAWWKQLSWRRVGAVALIALGIVLAGTTVVAFAYDRAESDKLMPGVKIAGVDVGGMSRDAAIRAVRKPVRYRLAHPIAIHAGKRTLHVVPRKLGVTANVAGAVDRALESAGSMTWFDRSYHRLFGWSVGESVPVANWLPEKHIRGFVDHLVRKIDRPAQNAAIALSQDQMRVVKQHATKGLEVDPKVVLTRVVAALRTARSEVTIPVQVTRPKVPDAELGKTIAIDLTTNELHVWDGFRVVKTYPVATAITPYSTPIGTWQVVQKEHDPVWINPGSAWAASMPPMIPPGPSNPLGLRALRTSAPGILIHGTPEDYSVGHYASHGCIRMHESDAIALYPLVPVGTPVVIYGAPPWGASTVAGAPPGY